MSAGFFLHCVDENGRRPAARLETKPNRTGVIKNNKKLDLIATICYAVGIILSPQTAMNTVIADYASAIHFNTTIVYDLKLEYVLLGDRNIGLWLRPVWNLYTKSVVDPHPDSEDWGRDWSVFEYKSILISADTGVILTDLLDAR